MAAFSFTASASISFWDSSSFCCSNPSSLSFSDGLETPPAIAWTMVLYLPLDARNALFQSSLLTCEQGQLPFQAKHASLALMKKLTT
jgi:hypothetical protein